MPASPDAGCRILLPKIEQMNMSISNIRASKPQDLVAIKSVIDATELFPSEYLDDIFSGDSNPEAGQEFWLTYDDNGVYAVAYYAPEQMTNGTWNLLLIAVHPDRQCEGIGSLLMSYVESILKNIGMRVLLVETSGTAEFVRTRSFYEQMGYENEARIRDYCDAGDDKITFRKAL